jgi:hypothetical protein
VDGTDVAGSGGRGFAPCRCEAGAPIPND